MLNIGSNLTTIPGWLGGGQAIELYRITQEYNRLNAIGVEVGSLHGRSSYVISTAIPLGKLYCIDLWDGHCLHNSDFSDELIKKNYYPTTDMFNTLEFFLDNVKDRTNIYTIQGSSPECVNDWDTMIDIIFLDASHRNPTDIDNITFWLPKIKPGGMFIGHDDYDKDVSENIK